MQSGRLTAALCGRTVPGRLCAAGHTANTGRFSVLVTRMRITGETTQEISKEYNMNHLRAAWTSSERAMTSSVGSEPVPSFFEVLPSLQVICRDQKCDLRVYIWFNARHRDCSFNMKQQPGKRSYHYIGQNFETLDTPRLK